MWAASARPGTSSGPTVFATLYVNFVLAAFTRLAVVRFLPAFFTAARKRSADQYPAITDWVIG